MNPVTPVHTDAKILDNKIIVHDRQNVSCICKGMTILVDTHADGAFENFGYIRYLVNGDHCDDANTFFESLKQQGSNSGESKALNAQDDQILAVG